ncbi:hypothetical protein Pyn_10126 [Prunus yedoensis var. nudiflora]|uniref:Uncharacterized protein n=1 Tax=Prunus yedoensis var. nudiflora TaxID=2094558 RepID=A0A314YRT4_PRUYE|nr:hypothetical protein Pyn_10126 [Prunus yedoensis var. nudiflora]
MLTCASWARVLGEDLPFGKGLSWIFLRLRGSSFGSIGLATSSFGVGFHRAFGKILWGAGFASAGFRLQLSPVLSHLQHNCRSARLSKGGLKGCKRELTAPSCPNFGSKDVNHLGLLNRGGVFGARLGFAEKPVSASRFDLAPPSTQGGWQVQKLRKG